MVHALWNNQRLNFLEIEKVGTKYGIYNNTEELANKLHLEDTCSNDYIEREAPGYKESIPRNRRRIRMFKRLRGPGIDSKEWFRQAGTRFLGFLKGSQIRAPSSNL